MPTEDMKAKHLLFYDGSCGLCDHAVQFVLERDKSGLFAFAPLQGETVQTYFNKPPGEDSLILIEDFKLPKSKRYLFGKGAFRILWLLGGPWALLGVMNFLPASLYDWAYRLVAKNRHRIFRKDSCRLPAPQDKSRFLP